MAAYQVNLFRMFNKFSLFQNECLSVLNLDVRETQGAAIQLYQSLGYSHYGTHPRYARVEGQWVAGLFFWKDLA